MLVKPRQFSPHSYPNGDHLSPARFPLFHAGHMKQHHITIIKKINRPFCFQQNIFEICNPIIKECTKRERETIKLSQTQNQIYKRSLENSLHHEILILEKALQG